jgi:Carboxypeptidase regulatory-like domain
MNLRINCSRWIAFVFAVLAFLPAPAAVAQETLGGITGTVTDTSGAVVVGTTVELVGDQTKLTRTQTTNSNGSYLFVKPYPPFWCRQTAP